MANQMKKPKVVQFPVNNICNSRCQMCDIWKQSKGRELSPLELKKIVADPLFSEVQGVGMNGGEPTLRKDLADLAHELIVGLPNLRQISLITNGLAPNLVIPRTAELYKVTKATSVKLDIMLSLDGVGEVHDRVRGRNKNFEAVEECLDYFRSHDIGDSYRLGCTLIADNIEDAERLMLWSEKKNVYCRFRVGIPHQRLYTKDKEAPFSLSKRQVFHLCNFLDTLIYRYESSNPQRQLFLKNLRDQICYGAPRANGCAWQEEGVTLLSDGGFAYCAVESPALGNLLEGPDSASSLYAGNQAVLRDIIDKKCGGCLHDYEGKIQGLKDRLAVRSKQFFAKYKLPTAPLRYAAFTASVVRNVTRLLAAPLFAGAITRASKPLPKILIVGWYGTETLGDKAILYSIIQQLNAVGVGCDQIVIASIEPYVTRNTLDEFSPVSNCDVISLAEAEQSAREGFFTQVIFGGGPIMSSIDYLCPIASIFSIVKRQGGQAIVWGCGIGPIRTKKRDFLNKLAIQQILRLADYCVFRDQKSHKLALSFGVSSDPVRTSTALDPAFHWVQSVHSDDCADSCDSAGPSPVGFAIRELPISEYFSDYHVTANDLRAAFDKAIVGLIDQHASHSPVHLQCMHRLPCGGDDRLYYCDLLGQKAFDYGLSLIHSSPVEDVERLSSLGSLYAMRFHSVVFAVALGVPVVPIDYTNGGKISSFCQSLGIRCWSPDELVHQIKTKSLPLEAQVPDSTQLSKIIQDSLRAYSELAGKVSHFVRR